MGAQRDQMKENTRDVHPQIFDQSNIFYMIEIFSIYTVYAGIFPAKIANVQLQGRNVLWKSVSKKELNIKKMVVKPEILSGSERDRQWSRSGQQMKMLRVSVGVMRMDRIKKESIRGTAHTQCFGG